MSSSDKNIRNVIIEQCRDQIEALVRSVQEGLDHGRPSYGPMLVCVVAIMQELHKVRGMDNDEKKELLKDIMIEALTDHLSEDELAIVETSLDYVADSLWNIGRKVIFPAVRRCKAMCC